MSPRTPRARRAPPAPVRETKPTVRETNPPAGETPGALSRETGPLTAPPAGEAPGPASQVLRWIVTGQADADVLQAIAHYWPGVPPADLAGAVADELQRAGRPDQDLIRGFAIEATREILRRALEAGDWQASLRAVRNIADYAATYQPGPDDEPEPPA